MNATSPDQWLVTGPGKIQWSVIWVQHLVRTNSYICERYSFLGPLLWCCGFYEEKRPPQDPDCTLALQHVGYFTRPKYPQCECKWIFLMIILWCGIPGPLIRVLYVNTTLRARICVIGIGSGQCFWSMQFVHARRHLHPEHYCLCKGSTPHVWSHDRPLWTRISAHDVCAVNLCAYGHPIGGMTNKPEMGIHRVANKPFCRSLG